MRIKRFEARDTKTAIAMVKAEMGDDAVILATRTLKGGKNGSAVEVVAAVDYDLETVLATEPAEPTPAPPPQRPFSSAGYGYETLRAGKKPPAVEPKPEPKARSTAPVAPDARERHTSRPIWADVSPRGAVDQVHSEAHDLRLRFANVLKTRPPAAIPAKPSPPSSLPPSPTVRAPKPKPEEVARWRDQLVEQIQLKDDSQATMHEGPEIIALVGATGVGKTTTAAKLAAWHSLRENCRVALLSMDCYRVGATDQLRTYARIMRIPCEVVLRRPELEKALARHADKDLIIIDTAGKSPYDEQHVPELASWFAPFRGRIEPHLVLAATSKKEDLQAIVAAYTPLILSGLILTKLDETRAYAALCQQIVGSALPVSYLCTGQRVPEDFLVASKSFLDDLFKKGWSAVTGRTCSFGIEAARIQ